MRIGKRLALVLGMVLTASSLGVSAEIESSIARGGRLYDSWYDEKKGPRPADDHPAFPNKGGQYGKAASWRCKECHGWDYRGKDGDYASGAHRTGIIGIAAAAGKDPAAIAAILRGPLHAYSQRQLSDDDILDLARFVSRGQIDMLRYIDVAGGKPKGEVAKGEIYFATICVGCHGLDGKKITTSPPLGSVSTNPWEVMHKILNGTPGEAMPSLRALDHQIAADLAAYLQTLPRQ